jgi:urease accessory protein
MQLSLLQLADSALPIGGYSHSWGLEAAVGRQLVRDAAGLERWTRFWLRSTLGPFEGVVVGVVCPAAADQDWPIVLRANGLLRAGLAPPTLRQASREMGEQLLALAEAWPWATKLATTLRGLSAPSTQVANALGGVEGPPPAPEWHHAVVFATLAAAASCTPAEAVAVYLHQAALGVISAGVRAIPIGHTHGQQVLARLHDDIRTLADELAERELETTGSFCPAYEILCHAQGRLYTRLFRS